MIPRRNHHHLLSDINAVSKAVRFLMSAFDALPSTVGDRERVAILSNLMSLAITARMVFKSEDGAVLESARIAIRTCAGVFDPLDVHWYYLACQHGGTYARMWESHRRVKPFISAKVYTPEGVALGGNRIAPGMAVIVRNGAGPNAEKGLELERTMEGHAIWWCTSINFAEDRIILCRYRSAAPTRNIGRSSRPHEPTINSPASRLKLDRAAWERLQGALFDLDAPCLH